MIKFTKTFIFFFLLGFLLLSCGANDNESGSNESTETINNTQNLLENDITIAYGDTVYNLQLGRPIKDLKISFKDSVIFQQFEVTREKVTIPINNELIGLGIHRLTFSYNQNGNNIETTCNLLVVPKDKTAKIVKRYPHSSTAYTQGLEFINNDLYEGTGMLGQSYVAKVDLKTGKNLIKKELIPEDFGEGITILNNKLYQLTWKNHKCYVYDLKSLDIISQFNYNTEGWGLTNDGESLIMSDGTENIYFRDPESFEITRTVKIKNTMNEQKFINELEFVEDRLYANIYGTNYIVEINPQNGIITAQINCGGIVKEMISESGGMNQDEVLNGIAYNKLEKKFYITGKHWKTLYEIKF